MVLEQKSTLAYLHYKETGDPSPLENSSDSIVMNLDDLIYRSFRKHPSLAITQCENIPGPVLAELIAGTESFLEDLRSNGISIVSGGGETADVGDLTQTVTVDSCAVAILNRDHNDNEHTSWAFNCWIRIFRSSQL